MRSQINAPGLLAAAQTKSALRGSRSSCRVMEPLEAGTPMFRGALEGPAAPLFWPDGPSPFRRSSSAFSANLFSAGLQEQNGRGGDMFTDMATNTSSTN